MISTLLEELKQNYTVYNKERSNTKWKLSTMFETKSQFGYGNINDEFSDTVWKALKTDLKHTLQKLNNIGLFTSVEYVFNSYQLIKQHSDVNQFVLSNPKVFNETAEECIEELERAIKYLSS